jgi:hypothetical protein
LILHSHLIQDNYTHCQHRRALDLETPESPGRLEFNPGTGQLTA